MLKTEIERAKIVVEEIKQQSQSQGKILEVILGVVGQHSQEVAFGSTRQLSGELGGQHLMNFHEASESHCSLVQVENRYLPPHRRENGSSTNVNGEHSNLVIIVAPQRLFDNTNPITQPRAYNELLPFVRGMRGNYSTTLGG